MKFTKPYAYQRSSGLSPKLVQAPALFDRWLILAVFGLLTIGLLMVTSASMVISERQYDTSFHYITRQLCYLTLGVVVSAVILRLELKFWQKISGYLLMLSFILLILVLIPGLGRRVNGSMRWLYVGPLGFQVSEFVKLAMILFLASYLDRRQAEVKSSIIGFVKPLLILLLMAGLLLLEPDFGACVVLFATAFAMLFLAGARLWQFAVIILLAGLALAVLAISSPYRLQRLTGFLNPWANQFNSGYQLTQSLIAFGRGGWFGVGLGDSIQKLFYLPEAHTDFLFAVLAEELGFVGEIAVISLFSLLVARSLWVGRRAYKQEYFFSAYLAYGISLWIGMQAMVNIGVNAGLLPTKGLTLPLMSYGGSSLLIMCISVALIMRADYELRLNELGLNTRYRL